MSQNMRAVLVEAPHKARVAELPPADPAADEVMVRVEAAGICGSDVDLLHGTRPAPYVRYPIVPGHEWAGTVAAVGGRVSGIGVGDAVVAEGFRSCGICSRCREGRMNLCSTAYAETGFTHPGAFAEYVTVPGQLVHRLPEGTALHAAALLEPAACVANGLLEVDLRPGLAVAVVGGGTLGLLAVLMLGLVSPARLALVDLRADRLARGRDLGVSDAWNPADDEALAQGRGRFDLVVEATGNTGGVTTALTLCRRGGTVVLEGIGASSPSISPDQITLAQLRLQGSFGSSSAAWDWVVHLFTQGLLDPSPLITHGYPLEEYHAAFGTVQHGDALKVQLLPHGERS